MSSAHNQENISYSSEITLYEIITELMKYWKAIAIAIAIGITTAVIYLQVVTPVYEIKSVLKINPGLTNAPTKSNSLGGLGSIVSLAGLSGGASPEVHASLATFTSRQFIAEFIEKKKLRPRLFAEFWDNNLNTWKTDIGNPPSIWVSVDKFLDMLNVELDPVTGLIELSIRWVSPEEGQQWLSDLIEEVNNAVRNDQILRSENNINYLNNELRTASLMEIRANLSNMVSNEIYKVMLAKGSDDFAFQVLDAPMAPPEGYYYSPRRLRVLALAIVLSVIFSFSGVMVRFLVQRSAYFSDERAVSKSRG